MGLIDIPDAANKAPERPVETSVPPTPPKAPSKVSQRYRLESVRYRRTVEETLVALGVMTMDETSDFERVAAEHDRLHGVVDFKRFAAYAAKPTRPALFTLRDEQGRTVKVDGVPVTVLEDIIIAKADKHLAYFKKHGKDFVKWWLE